MKARLVLVAMLVIAMAVLATSEEVGLVYHRTVAGVGDQPVCLPLNTEEDMIAYDDAPAVYYNYTSPGTKFAVRFTPLQACTLSYIEVVSYQAPGPALIHIYSNSAGSPGTDLITPLTVTLNGSITYQRININPRIDIGHNDFHVGVEYLQAPPPYVTADNNGVTQNRSKVKRPTDVNWINLGNDLNIRAYVRYYGSDMVPPTINHTWRVLGFSMEGDHPIEATITDNSGVASAAVNYSVDGVTYNTVAMTNVSGNLWRGLIPNQPVGTVVRYYITAVDASPNSNQATFPPGGQSSPYVMTIVLGTELAYDNGVPCRYWIVDTAYHDNAFAVRMTPTFYPAKVMLARAYVSGDNSVSFTINGVSAGAPGSVLPGGEEVDASRGPHNWAIATWPNGPVINSGSFFFVFHWMQTSPDDPAVAQDTTGNHLRSYWYSSSSGWNAVTDGDWIMRTVVATPSGIQEIGPDGVTPARFELLRNYPNPFNPSTEIEFLAPVAGHVNVSVYNLAGQLVKTVYDGQVEAGIRTVTWDGKDASGADVSSGIYFFRLEAPGQVDAAKMVLIR